MAVINGEKVNVQGITVAEYLAQAGYHADRVVVERNMVILQRTELAKTIIEEGDSIEILNFVGGG